MPTPSPNRIALIVAAFASFLTPFMASAVIVALPTIGRRFDLDAVGQGWVIVGYSLSAAVCLLPLGRLADILGHRRLFVAGLWLFAVSTSLAGLAPSAHALLASRVLQGLSGALIFGTSVAIVTAVFPASERGRVMGITIAAVYVGLSVGPPLGGVMTQALGWRSVFLATAPFAAVAALLAQVKLREEWAEARGERFDLVGAILYGVSLAAFVIGLTRRPVAAGVVPAASGLVGLVLFVWYERRSPAPLLDVRLLVQNRVFAFSNLAALINYSATAGSAFLLSLYLQHLRGLSPRVAGLVLLAQPVVQAALSPPAGRLSDRIEPRLVASWGMAVTALGLAALVYLGSDTPLAAVVACLMALGLGFALFSSPNTSAIMGSVERRQYGVASATLATMRLVGQTLSNGLAMLMLTLYLGSEQVTPAQATPFLHSVRASFALFAACCAVGVLFSLVRGRLRPD